MKTHSKIIKVQSEQKKKNVRMRNLVDQIALQTPPKPKTPVKQSLKKSASNTRKSTLNTTLTDFLSQIFTLQLTVLTLRRTADAINHKLNMIDKEIRIFREKELEQSALPTLKSSKTHKPSKTK